MQQCKLRETFKYLIFLINAEVIKMEKLKFLKMDNKAKLGKGSIAVLIGALLLIVLAVALAPTMFNGSNNISGAPTWLNTALPAFIAVGLIVLIAKGMDLI